MGRDFDARQIWNQQRNKNGDDGYHDKQFNPKKPRGFWEQSCLDTDSAGKKNSILLSGGVCVEGKQFPVIRLLLAIIRLY